MTNVVGPVPIGSPFYARRAFESATRAYLLNREWVLIQGPRQHGKTSALIRIQAEMIESGFRCAFVDLQRLPPVTTYPNLLRWFAREVATSLQTPAPEVPQGREDELEAWLSCAIPHSGTPVIILIDEVSRVHDAEIRTSFFGQIRAMKTAGATASGIPGIGPIQFAFAGTFRQEALVAERNSPFNVSRRVETDDLTVDQVAELAGQVVGERAAGAATAVFQLVGGQPHLVQHMLAMLDEEGDGSDEDRLSAEFDRLLREGSDHLDALFRLVFEDARLTEIARTAATHGDAENDAANDDTKYMIAVGLMRRAGGRLVFRNRLYEDLTKASAQLRPEQVNARPPQQHLVALGEAAFSFMADGEMREIAYTAHNGGVAAYNQGAYRMALVGFGVCVEAMLITWLTQQSSVALAAGVAAAQALHGSEKANFNHFESAVSPETWRLVNLMRVGRQMRGVRGPLSLPDSLRDMRNFVHPKLMKQHYMREVDLQPEAMAASAFTIAIKRDLS